MLSRSWNSALCLNLICSIGAKVLSDAVPLAIGDRRRTIRERGMPDERLDYIGWTDTKDSDRANDNRQSDKYPNYVMQ